MESTQEKHVESSVVELTDLASPSQSEDTLAEKQSETISRAPTWPSEPVPLVPEKKAKLFASIYDGVLLAVPFVLIVKIALVVVAWWLDRDNTNEYIDQASFLTTFLIEFNGQLVTAFTIIFVTIMATLVKRYALWKAQKGAYVAELEQLQGSTSLPSTIKLVWSLRAWTLTSVSLVVIWALQYLGSQASKREFLLSDSGMWHKTSAGFAGSNYTSTFWPYQNAEAKTQKISDLNRNLFTSISYYDNAGQFSQPFGIDNNGNALIPNLQILVDPDFYGGVNDPIKQNWKGWYDVSKQSKNEYAYSSMVGRQLWFYDQTQSKFNYSSAWPWVGDGQFTTSYLTVGCSAAEILDYRAFPNGTLGNSSISFNLTAPSPDTPRDAAGNLLQNFDLWYRWQQNATLGINTTQSAHSVCNVTSVSVDMKVHCQASGCLPNQMRYTNNNLTASTSYNTPFSNEQFASLFFSNLILSDGIQEDVNTFTDIGWLLDINTAVKYFSSVHVTPTVLESKMREFISGDLTLIFNTYYMLTQQSTQVIPHMDKVFFNGTDGVYDRILFKGAQYNLQYAIYWYWIAIDFCSCVVLFVAAFSAHWLRVRTLAPDIFGYVSTLTRDNPNLGLPDSGTALNGIERSRLLRKVKVKLGDVSRGSEPVGRIGLASADATVATVEPLRATDEYRYV